MINVDESRGAGSGGRYYGRVRACVYARVRLFQQLVK